MINVANWEDSILSAAITLIARILRLSLHSFVSDDGCPEWHELVDRWTWKSEPRWARLRIDAREK